MKNFLNEQILNEWIPLLEQQIPSEKLKNNFGTINSGKENWLAEYCHNHAMYDTSMGLNESFAYGTAATLGNIPGMGAVRPGAAPGGPLSFYTGTTGSGDKFPSLLPLAIQVAARTVGFDIVSVIPMPGPTGVLTYLDYVYGGGKLGTTEQPLVISVDVDDINATQYVVGTKYWGVNTAADAARKVIEMIFIGYSRITGYPLFRIGNTYITTQGDNTGWELNEGIAVSEIFDTDALLTADSAGKPIAYASLGAANSISCTSKANLVRGLEDHIQGYSGAGTYDQDNWSGPFTEGSTPMTPMGRGTGESTYYRPMNIQAYTKFIEAETYQVAATVTTEQIQDLNKQFGIDVVSMIENALVNEISQSINKHILSRAFALGWTNNAEFLKVEHATLNFNVNKDDAGTGYSPYYLNKVGFTERIKYNDWAEYGGFENMHTIQRRIQSKLIAAGNIIAQRGRRGPANFAVTNLQLATALQDSAQFTFAPMQNTINQSNGSLYPIGMLAGMTIYVDPNMRFDDNRVLVGRKGEDQEPGLKFMPYLMAESIQTIAEGSMSPKIAVKSRYALVEAGHWPQTQYYTFYVYTGNQLIF